MKLNQEEIENMNRSNTNTIIETVVKKTSKNKSSEPDGYIGKFHQIFREELTPILLKIFQKSSIPKLIPWGHNNPNNKTGQVYHKKVKIIGQYYWWT